MANGITIETLQFVQGRADWHRACLCCSTAAFHLLLGTVHVLSAPGASPVNKKKRCIVRFLSAASLLPVAGTSWEAVSVLLYISVVCITEVLVDLLQLEWDMAGQPQGDMAQEAMQYETLDQDKDRALRLP